MSTLAGGTVIHSESVERPGGNLRGIVVLTGPGGFYVKTVSSWDPDQFAIHMARTVSADGPMARAEANSRVQTWGVVNRRAGAVPVAA